MARRKQSALEDLVQVVSNFHWGVGVSLAVVAYAFLHWYTGQELPVAKDMSDISGNMLSGLFHGLANVGKYILPFVFLLGAGISLFSRQKRSNLYETTKSNLASNLLENMSWQDFEFLIGEHFRRQGYRVRETACGADGGVDLILNKEGDTYFVQCKQWRAYKVAVKIVRELLGVMSSRGAVGGYVVTSGQFTQDAVVFAKANNIELIDGSVLRKLLKSSPDVSSFQSEHQAAGAVNNSEVKKICPKCGNPLIERVARKGRRAGQKFMGCSTFPACRFTAPVE